MTVCLSLLFLIFMTQSLLALPQSFNLIELSARPWLYSLSQERNETISTLDAIPDDAFQHYKDLGFDMVYFMGVWQLGQFGLNFDRMPAQMNQFKKDLPGCTTADVIGSPFAVVNYTCNGEIGTDPALLRLKKRLNNMGLKLMLDFVPNHSAVDSPWFASHPEYYIHAPKGAKKPYAADRYLPNGVAFGWAGWGGGWEDTAQLNYWNDALIAQRVAQLMKVASLADGIRCDMAYLLLNDQIESNWGVNLASHGYKRPQAEFWQHAIAAVKQKYPHVVFMAEAYDPWQAPLQDLGFDYTYDKYLLDQLAAHDVGAVAQHIPMSALDYTRRSAHFLSNHDEPRAITKFGGVWWQANAAALLTFTLPGIRFFWWGQLRAYLYHLDVQLRRERPSNDPSNGLVTTSYAKLLGIVSEPVFRSGKWTLLSAPLPLIAYRWDLGAQRRLCVINFSDTVHSTQIVLPGVKPVNGNDTIDVVELLTDTVYQRSAHQLSTKGLIVVVPKWYAQIFSF